MAPASDTACLDDPQLLDLADGVASRELRARADTHLDRCPDCQARLAGFLRARAPSTPDTPTDAPRTPTTLLEAPPSSRRMPLSALERGTLLGRYVVLERIGAGGMGVVYAAYDPSIDRRVGLKLVAATDQVLSEARAAARTQHPSVVAVHDVGRVDDRVFIAMELVEGGTLRQHLASARPDWRGVTRLYLQAGHGLAAAHAAGVIHRDFKPDNVLVDRAGRAKVTDFGLARLAAPMESLPARASTDIEPAPHIASTAAAGTPGYIAPEVLAGGRVDARSDQFSFCVALFEGLSGVKPGAPEAREAIARASVPRALLAVVQRGLCPAPTERYPSMDALLMALERAAFPRTSRWLGAAGALVGLAAVLTAILVTRGPRPCTDSASRLVGIWDASRKASLREAFLATKAPEAESAHAALSQSLDAQVGAWTEAHRDACEDTHVRQEQSEAAMDLRMNCLERARRELRALVDVLRTANANEVSGAPQMARGLSDVSSCDDAEALARPVPPPSKGPDVEKVREAYETLADAKARDIAGRWSEVQALAATVEAAARAVGYKPLLGEALLAQGRVKLHERDEKEAARLLRQAVLASQVGRDDDRVIEEMTLLVQVEGELAERPEHADLWRDLAQAQLERIGGDEQLESNLTFAHGLVLTRQGRHAEAIVQLERCIAIRERTQGKDAYVLLDALLALGTAQRGVGRLEEALATQQRTRTLLVRHVGAEHPFVAMTLNNLAGTLIKLRRYDEGLATYDESIRLFERIHGPGQPASYLMSLHGNIGAVEASRGRYEPAREALERAWALAREHRPPGHPDRAFVAGNLAVVLAGLGKVDDAVARVEAMRAELDAAQAEGRRSQRHADLQTRMAEIFLKVRRFEQAATQARAAAALLGELGVHAERATPLCRLAMALLGSGRLVDAERVAREAVTLRERTGSSLPEDLAEARSILGQVLLAKGDAEQARGLLDQALEDWEKDGASAFTLAETRFALARALRQAGVEPERARALALSARDAVAPTSEPRSPRLEEVEAFLTGAPPPRAAPGRVDFAPR
ncbi:serine/threonine-protein kinase [Myxococcus sp. XM-1-1-1]|uniref:serine/threonine-protein kinase n=1 Tax=Myxococcus sp. XM-1-1-1 TaxID=2874602 RepID=UPI001DFF578B|nr:serine/threonine-protein kinase [Myxococcus sp. XM-1-1-1]MBZ4413498.1 serine/threonine-protein kinase [Myxococcus sp. XM-1-1-1]